MFRLYEDDSDIEADVEEDVVEPLGGAVGNAHGVLGAALERVRAARIRRRPVKLSFA